MCDTKTLLHASRVVQLLTMVAAIGCGGDQPSSQDSPQAIGTDQGRGAAGASVVAPTGPMPGLGTMMMTPASGVAGEPALAGAGASGALASAGTAGTVVAGHTGSAGVPGAAGTGGSGSSAGASGAAGAGVPGSAGAPSSGAPGDDMDPTSVCMGGTPGMDSDAVTTRGQTSSRNFSLVSFLLPAPNKIARFQTILLVPKLPAQRSTLFIWPGLQHRAGSDPGRLGNGVLQPVLTWGPSCNPKAPRKGTDYNGWWISGMYVNISTGAAGPGGCAGGDAMDVAVGDRLYIDFSVEGTEWTQTVLDLATMKKVDFTMDLEGQDQNWAIWDIETPGSSKPAEDTYFEKSVLSFASPVTSCQPTSASEVDYFSAPILSPDGLHCCYEKMTLKAKRN